MRWITYAAGVTLIALGVTGLFKDSNPIGWALWFGGILIAHDAILLPAVLLAGTAVTKAGQTTRTALTMAALITAATLPTVLAMGRRPDNPSILPLDYTRNLLIVLAATVLIAIARSIANKTVVRTL